jgi:very-short-patch-repair endonuclease
MGKSDLETALANQIRDVGLPEPEREYRFHPTRRWRFDFAWPDYMLAAEVEGGVWVRGAHNRGAGFIKDCIKYNEAALLGWTVLRFAGAMITDGVALDCLEQMLERLREMNE